MTAAARQPISILAFADSVLGIRPYPWQSRILLNYEAGNPTAAAVANNCGKTSLIFPVCSLWSLFSFPRARVQYITASGDQLKHQFFAYIESTRIGARSPAGNGLRLKYATRAPGCSGVGQLTPAAG